MMVYCSGKHVLHEPRHELWGGRARPHPEVPERVEAITKEMTGHEIREAEDPGSALARVHDKEYLEHLRRACSELSATAQAFPFVFWRCGRPPPNDLARRGYYSYDTVTPLSRGTFEAALGSAGCAVSGAREVRRSQEAVYCLCRPPGHHASGRMMAGYCYLNNAALAAFELGGRGAILDIDSHHGNGTQEIFYDTKEVLFCSVHGDPRTRFPYSWGHRREKGNGRGLGYTMNLPLPGESRGRAWINAIVKLLTRIEEHDPEFLVVSLGTDGLVEDRNGPFRLTIAEYSRAGVLIEELGIPACIVQEGGYHLPLLGRATRAFLDAWD